MKIVRNCQGPEGDPGFMAYPDGVCYTYTPGDTMSTIQALKGAARDANDANAAELGRPELSRGSVAG